MNWTPTRLLVTLGLFALLGLAACSIFPIPSFLGGSPAQVDAGVIEEGAVAATSSFLSQISRFAWLSVLLVLFFPTIRTPLVNLWTSIFGALAIPFLAIRQWYDNRSNPKKGGKK